VVGSPDDRWGEAVTAVVVRRAGYDVTEADVIQCCRASLAGYKAPKQVVFWDSVPKNPVGKILRREVRDTFWADRDRKVN
jgi:fatty-acyl-CoA synthase